MNYDLTVLMGTHQKDEIIGFGADGYLGAAGLRTECLFMHTDTDKETIRFATGLDYSFPNSLYLMAEYFFNGNAEDNDPDSFISSPSYSQEYLSQKKHLVSLQASYDITPL